MMRRMVGRLGRIALVAFVLGLAGLSAGEGASWCVSALEAQSIRISGSSQLRYIEARTLARDSVASDEVEGSGFLRQTADGRVVRCVVGAEFCRGTRPGPTVSTVPVVQDLEFNAWGLGQGIHAHAEVRIRDAWGGRPELWPQADETLDVLAAWGEFSRERYRIRAGRQWTSSGLGFYNFDGVSLLVRPVEGLSVEGQAGRSLVRGLNEPRSGDALEAIEELAPVEPGLMLNGRVSYRPSARFALSGLYHRDIRDDRAGLYSELARLEGVWRIGGGSIEGSMERDLAGGQFNELRVRAVAPPVRSIALSGHLRRYRPYFELWTIWGAFSPVGFDEGRVNLAWARPSGDLIVRGHASARSYDETGMENGTGSFRTDGWGAGANASWSPRDLWRVEGGYRVELGFGAARSEGELGLQRRLPDDRGHLAVRGVAFQRLYEFRLDHGAVLGLGAEGAWRLTDRSRLTGNLTAYRHVDRGDGDGLDWTQLRAGFRLSWTVGAEPSATPGDR